MEATLLDGCNAILLIDGPNDASNAPISAFPVEISLRICTVKKVHFAPLPEKHQAPYTAARISKRKKTRRPMVRTEYTGPQKYPQEGNKEKNDGSESVNLDDGQGANSPTAPSSSEGPNNNNNTLQAPLQVPVPVAPHSDALKDPQPIQGPVSSPPALVMPQPQRAQNELVRSRQRQQDLAHETLLLKRRHVQQQENFHREMHLMFEEFQPFMREQRELDRRERYDTERQLKDKLEKERSRREQQFEKELEKLRALEQQYQRTELYLTSLCGLFMAVIMLITL